MVRPLFCTVAGGSAAGEASGDRGSGDGFAWKMDRIELASVGVRVRTYIDFHGGVPKAAEGQNFLA